MPLRYNLTFVMPFPGTSHEPSPSLITRQRCYASAGAGNGVFMLYRALFDTRSNDIFGRISWKRPPHRECVSWPLGNRDESFLPTINALYYRMTIDDNAPCSSPSNVSAIIIYYRSRGDPEQSEINAQRGLQNHFKKSVERLYAK